MINGFVEDNCFQDLTQDVFKIAENTLPCGTLPPELLEYMVDQIKIKDKRSSRLPILYREVVNYVNDTLSYPYNSITYLLQDTLLSLYTSGNTASIVQFNEILNATANVNDNNMPDPNNGPVAMSLSTMDIIFDKDYSSQEYDAWVNTITPSEKEKIFNIIEYLFYGTIPSDDLSYTENVLTSNNDFLGYKENSVELSENRTIVYIYDDFHKDGPPPTYGFYRFIPNWIKFTFIYDSSNPKEIEFKLWISKNDFEINYPISTIVQVIPPLPLDDLRNPSNISSIYQAVEKSTLLSANDLASTLHIDDYSGFAKLTVPYILQDQSYDLTFGILYKGRTPTSSEIRIYIRNIVLNNDVATWKQYFPTLFVDHTFYFIPLYDNSYILESNSETIYPSITLVDFENKLTNIIGNIVNIGNTPIEIFTVNYNTLFILAVCGDTNINKPTLKSLLPTYQDYSINDPRYNTMTPDAKLFAKQINDLLAQCMNEQNDTEFLHNKINQDDYYSFVQQINVDGNQESCEFMMITSNSYLD